MAEVILELDDSKVDLLMNWLQIAGGLLPIIGGTENPLKSQMKIPNNPNEKQNVVLQLNGKECA